MARLNPKRRRELKLQKALIELKKATNPAMVATEGHMRSSHKAILPAVTKAPRPALWEGMGKSQRKSSKRWGTK